MRPANAHTPGLGGKTNGFINKALRDRAKRQGKLEAEYKASKRKD